jgi:hypothetical protein
MVLDNASTLHVYAITRPRYAEVPLHHAPETPLMHKKAAQLHFQTNPISMCSKYAALKRENNTKCCQRLIREPRCPPENPDQEDGSCKNYAFDKEAMLRGAAIACRGFHRQPHKSKTSATGP